MVKKKSLLKKTGFFWRLLISAVGFALLMIAVLNLSLFFFGDIAAAKVSVRRFGGSDNGKPPDQRYQWAVDYTFADKSGKTQNGHTTKRGSDLSVKTDKRVYYFSFAPFINAMESEAKPSYAQVLYIVLGVFLIFIMNRKKKGINKDHSKKKDVIELNDYDDSVEESFHNSENDDE